MTTASVAVKVGLKTRRLKGKRVRSRARPGPRSRAAASRSSARRAAASWGFVKRTKPVLLTGDRSRYRFIVPAAAARRTTAWSCSPATAAPTCPARAAPSPSRKDKGDSPLRFARLRRHAFPTRAEIKGTVPFRLGGGAAGVFAVVQLAVERAHQREAVRAVLGVDGVGDGERDRVAAGVDAGAGVAERLGEAAGGVGARARGDQRELVAADRARQSPPRTTAEAWAASSRRTRSPVVWPKRSLICLKESMSASSSVKRVPVASRR